MQHSERYGHRQSLPLRKQSEFIADLLTHCSSFSHSAEASLLSPTSSHFVTPIPNSSHTAQGAEQS